MLTFMRWKPGAAPGTYQYFEIVKGGWVDCERSMYMWSLKQGTVWMNPVFNPAGALSKAA